MKTDIKGLLGSIDLDNLSKQELVEVINMTQKWAGPEETKFHLYKPAPMAVHFHASPAKCRALFGGNRSSKTYSHIIELAAQFTGIEPKSIKGTMPPHRLDPTRRLRLCMDDYPNNFLKVIWPYIQQLIPKEYIAEVRKEQGFIKSIHNHHGGLIEFMQYSQDRAKFQGSSLHGVAYDEEPPEDIRRENLLRLADTGGEETFSLTPVSGALKYLYDKIYCKRGREVEQEWDIVLNEQGQIATVERGQFRDIILPEGDPNIHVFFANIFDNPIMKKDDAIRVLSALGSKEELIVRAKGHFMFLSGLVYKEYSDHTHVVDDFDDWYKPGTSDDYTLYIAIDPHPRTPHAVLFMVARRDGQLFVVDELFMDCTAVDLVSAIKSKCMGKKPEVILVDPLAYTTSASTKQCFAYDLIEAGLNDPMPIGGSKDKENGIIITRRYLTVNDRGNPGVVVCRGCTKFRHEITHYAWDDWRTDTKNIKGEKQSPMEKDDHLLEDLRRILLLEPMWRSPHRGRNLRPTVDPNRRAGY